ncbi:MAG: HAD family phosphatase [Proteobacteria bacterium]|nr:HAD family phosphatase [Pseudomonadota bacterium]
MRLPLQAVLLDMDGTLLDTEQVYLASLIKALDAHGYPDATAICHAMIGLPGPECEAMLRDHYGEKFPLEKINTAYATHRDDLLAQGLPLKPGTLELLDALRDAECPTAIVTSSSRRTAHRYLSLAGIRDRFDAILTGDDVTRGKPHPDLYLLAAEQLGVAPPVCIAVEDSSPGVTAAHAAGATTIMVPDILQPNDDIRAKCAAVLPDLHVALALLRERYDLGARQSRTS